MRLNEKQQNKGFSLPEMLLVLAIMGLLLAAAVPNVISARRALRQRELDAKAEIIYMAAQNQLIKLRSGGNASLYQQPDERHAIGNVPSDAVVQFHDNKVVSRDLYYMSSAAGDAVAGAVMTPGTVEDELLHGSWVIEYEPDTGGVYAVFYAKDVNIAERYASEWTYCDALRAIDVRSRTAEVGYYGGDAGSTTSSTATLQPTLQVENGEKLTAFLQCTAPVGVDDLRFDLTLTDGFDNAWSKSYSGMELTKWGRSFYIRVTLDDLSGTGTRFHELFPELVPGSSLEVRLVVASQNMLVDNSAPVAQRTNSLFDDASSFDKNLPEGTAVVTCARHLQNLDDSSGADARIARAEQRADIDFADDPLNAKDWASYYGGVFFHGQSNEAARFKPIHNVGLTAYEGGGRSISALNAGDDGAAGLFGSASGLTVRNLTLTGARASGGSAAALIGVTDGDVTIEGCRVYLEAANGDLAVKDAKKPWISGTYAGGLVGVANSGTLTIRDSFASTVIRSTTRAGGLIGSVANGARVRLSGSYADSYIYGAQTGGLVGGGSVSSMENCYAAGFLSATDSSAGLVNGSVASAVNCYTICALGADTADGAAYYSTAYSLSGRNVYYFLSGSINAAGSQVGELEAAQLGNAFTGSGATEAYNLMDQSLNNYTFPHLRAAVVNTHYGDWQAEFTEAALVYFEQYAGENGEYLYGFYGANADDSEALLHDDLLLTGDGYGVIFRDLTAMPEAVTVMVGGVSYHIDTGTDDHYLASGVEQYRIYPLPAEAVNGSPAANDFYQEVRVSYAGAEGVSRFNPHFAKTVDASGKQVFVRSARQLYCMSRFYDEDYRAPTKDWIFTQERDISYADYNWAVYAGEAAPISEQRPIGGSEGKSFLSAYNGGSHVISGVSFSARDGDYIGMFGYNAGTLRDIVLATDYHPGDSSLYVRRTEGMYANDRIYMGTLAGLNRGVVFNCASAGYYVAGVDSTIHAYENSWLYAGGLVGGNSGTISNSSSGCPELRVSAIYANAYVGGFVGWNQGGGTIRSCYAIGHVEAAYAKEGQVHIAGFAGTNSGMVDDCYCATSLMASGSAESFGFSPLGGSVSNCQYLDQGTYFYVGTLRSYHADGNVTAGEAVGRAALQRQRAGAAANERNSRYHAGTSGSVYPYRAVVRNAAGEWSHYGDWQDDASLGTLGVFYWELEESGSNSGVHFSYVGTEEDLVLAGSTLCTAHDDGGVITAFGYGYYVLEAQAENVTLESKGIAVSADAGGGTFNENIADALHQQMERYTFYPYSTRTQSEAGEADYVCLDAQDGAVDGTWTLTFREGDTSTAHTYRVAPFFAGAIQLTAHEGVISAAATDGRDVDRAQSAGSEKNPYEIRSARQLQYINWNYTAKNTSTLVTSNASVYSKYTYLMYTRNSGKDTKAAAGNSDRGELRWLQTHDVDCSGLGSGYTPIAGSAVGTDTSNVNSRLYAWFGGHYDGQSYVLRNVEITSDCYTVGLFGVTVGANMKNIILYSDRGSTILRKTPNASLTNRLTGFYAIGGLIGIAYDYTSGTTSANTIENCAIAGYKIVDASTNQQGRGHGSTGGLIGLAYVNLERCSAVTDISIECMHQNGCMIYGSYVHSGGLTGVAKFHVTDCYTGGKITVAEETINEFYTTIGNSNNNINNPTYVDLGKEALNTTKAYDRNLNTHIYAGGLSGGVYSCSFTNFDGKEDGYPVFTNCYTYMDLPTLQGTIKGVSLIATVADRYGKSCSLTLKNCYYLNSVKDKLTYDSIRQPDYYFSNSSFANRRYVITEDEWEKMLLGDTRVNRKIISSDSTNPSFNIDLTGVTYDQLSSRSGFETESVTRYTGSSISNETKAVSGMTGALDRASWDWVTSAEAGGAAINGKYSFPGNNASLSGQNYPFPTVIRQNDLSYGTVNEPVWVNVHYGEWPQDGCYWEQGRANMDIFADMVMAQEDENAGWAVKTFKLYDTKGELTYPDFELSTDEIVQILDRTGNEDGSFDVTFKALRDGAVTVTAKEQGSEENGPFFVLEVTHDLKLAAEQERLTLYTNQPSDTLQLTAVSSRGEHDFSKLGAWTLSAAESENDALYDISEASNSVWQITSTKPGSRLLAATFSYDYHSGETGGTSYRETMFLTEHTLGLLGLSDGVTYNEAWRANAEVQGVEPDPAYGEGNPPPTLPQGAEFFLYETASDEALSGLIVDRIFVNGEECVLAERVEGDTFAVYQTGEYQITLEDAPEPDGDFERRAGMLRYTGSGTPAAEVDVVIEAHFAMGDGVTNESYALQIKTGNIPTLRADFIGDENEPETTEGSMRPLGIAPNADGQLELTLPQNPFEKAGYRFAGWKIVKGSAWKIADGEPEDADSAAAGDTLFVKPSDDGKVVFAATWEEQTDT